jgi:hypothetical protein
MKIKQLLLLVSLALMLPCPLRADDDEEDQVNPTTISDGTHDAEVTTPSGTYTVPVEVSGGEVESVEWPNGGDMSLSGADIDQNGDATGTNSRGDSVDVHIDE